MIAGKYNCHNQNIRIAKKNSNQLKNNEHIQCHQLCLWWQITRMMMRPATVHQRISISPAIMKTEAIGALATWSVHYAVTLGNHSIVDIVFAMAILSTRPTIWQKGNTSNCICFENRTNKICSVHSDVFVCYTYTSVSQLIDQRLCCSSMRYW